MMLASIILAASLLENAQAITNYSAQIDAAIVAKGGTTAGGLTNAPAAIAALPTGGGGEWVKPSYWPDIRAILAADTASANPHGLEKDNRIILLLYCSSSITFTAQSFVYFENGTTYEGNGTIKTQNQTFNFDTDGYHWMIVYGNNYGTRNLVTPSQIYQGKVLWVYGDADKNNKIGGEYSTIVQDAYNISYIENCVFNSYYRIILSNAYSLNGTVKYESIISDLGSYGEIFKKCYNIKGMSGYLGITNGTVRATNWSLFTDCFHLQTLPDYLVIPKYNVTASNVGFQNMYSLRSLPKVLSPNTETATAMTYSFAKSILLSKDSVAKFSNGTIVDGFAAFLPVPAGHPLAGWTSDATGAAASRTFTLPEQVRAAFSSDEQTAIEEAFTAHNWTLAW